MRVEWKGIFTAIVTPFTEDGALDEDALRQLVQRQVDAGIHGILPCGTTGETPAMNDEEWARVIEITVEVAKGKSWIVAGTGTNNTPSSAQRTLKAKELGADGGLVITPYYNKPTPDGLYLHFKHVADTVPGFPIMVYNVPGRTALNLTPPVFDKLIQIPEISALKEAAGNLMQAWEYCRLYSDTVPVLSGEDGMNLAIWDQGARGAVSVLSNVVPGKVAEQWNAFEAGDTDRAYSLHREMEALAAVLFCETSPGPAKYAMNRMGLPAGRLRPPLAPVRKESEEKIDKVLKEMGLI